MGEVLNLRGEILYEQESKLRKSKLSKTEKNWESKNEGKQQIVITLYLHID